MVFVGDRFDSIVSFFMAKWYLTMQNSFLKSRIYFSYPRQKESKLNQENCIIPLNRDFTWTTYLNLSQTWKTSSGKQRKARGKTRSKVTNVRSTNSSSLESMNTVQLSLGKIPSNMANWQSILAKQAPEPASSDNNSAILPFVVGSRSTIHMVIDASGCPR